MSLAARLEQGPPAKRKPCRVRQICAALSHEESAAFLAMVTDPKWSDRQTFEALQSEGVDSLPQSDQFLGIHRRGQCDCEAA